MPDGIVYPRFDDPLGPRMVTVVVPSCSGCPALKLRTWRDEKGQHTAADCYAKRDPFGEPRNVAVCWRVDRHPPSWCPHDGAGRG